MKFYYREKYSRDSKIFYVDENIKFDKFELRKLEHCLQYIKDNPQFDMRDLTQFKIGGLKFRIGSGTYYSSIYNISSLGKNSTQFIQSPNTFIFDFGDEEDALMVTVDQKCLISNYDIKTPQDVERFYNGGDYARVIVNMGPKEEHNNKERTKLNCYKDYFEYLKKNLENNKAEYSVDINIMRNYYEEITNEIPDDETLIIPVVINKSGKIRSVKFICEQEDDEEILDNGSENSNQDTRASKNKNKYEELTLQKADLEILNSNEATEFLDKINDASGVELKLSKAHRLCRISNIDSKDMYKLRYFLTGSATTSVFIQEDITGEKIRLDRIIKGIKSVQHRDVENQKLVDAICSNSIEGFDNKYIKSDAVIELLKEENATIKNNFEQLQAIDKILAMERNDVDILLVQGPPGTGKTELIIALAKKLLKNNKTTLITSNVQVACDNIAERMRNDKEVIFKRYKVINSLEEKRENQQTYLINQVLSKYTIGDVVVNNEKQLNKFKAELFELKERLNSLEIEKKCVDKDNSDYANILRQIEDAEKETVAQNEKLNQLKLDKDSLLNKLDDVVKEYKTAEVSQLEVEKKLQECLRNTEDLCNVNAELDKQIKELCNMEDDSKTLLQNKDKQIKELNEELHSLQNIDIKWLSSLFDDCKRYQNPIKYYKELSAVKEINNILRIINILKGDYYFWNFDSKINKNTIALLDKYCSLFTLEDKDTIDQIVIAAKYSKMTFGEKFKLWLYGELYGISLGTYKSAKIFLQNLCIDYKYKFKNKINHIADNFINNIEKETKNKAEMLASAQESVLDIEEQIAQNSKLIKKYEKQLKSNDDIIEKLKELKSDNLEKLELINEWLDIEKKLEKTNKKIGSLNDEVKRYKDEKEDYEKNNENIIKYVDFYNHYYAEKMNITNRIDKISPVIEFINECIGDLTAQNNNSILFDYLTELQEIKEIEKIDKNNLNVLNKYFDGKTILFDTEFNIDEHNSSGSLISMTTSQVAKLNNNVVFDYAIIDEASKCCFEYLIVSLPKIKHLVLIGDFMQLDPHYNVLSEESDEIKELMDNNEVYWDQLKKSTFSLLLKQAVDKNFEERRNSFDQCSNIAVLKRQYRMNKDMFNLVSQVYTIHPEFEIVDSKNVSSGGLLCLNIADGEERHSGENDEAISNEKEVDYIAKILNFISDNRESFPNVKSIGVITGYAKQEWLLRRKLKKIEGLQLQIGTMDRFQGREYDLVFISLVRTDKMGFLKDVRRMNVAFSRAKKYLVILGNFDKIKNFIKPSGTNIATPEIQEKVFVESKLLPYLYSDTNMVDCYSLDIAKENIKSLLEKV